MQGIKKHTHEERTKIIQTLIPFIKEKFGDNLLSIAADGSYARGEDTDFSDVEFVVFLKEIQNFSDWSIHKIYDGQLVVIVAETKETFIEKYLDISKNWYASGAGKLLPLMNKSFITEINKFIPTHGHEKCLIQIRQRWPGYQEITAKLLNMIEQKRNDGILLVFLVMFREVLVILSYLNGTPYKTMTTYIQQAKQFPQLPNGFVQLVQILEKGKFNDLETLKKATIDVFSHLEEILENEQMQLYEHSLDKIV